MNQIKTNLLKIVKNHKKSVNKKINILRDNIKKETIANKAKKEADLLAANLYRIEEKSEEISLEDFYEENKVIVIKLDPRKTAWENINDLYSKSKKLKTSIIYAKKDIPKQKELLEYLDQLEDFINRAASTNDLDEIREEMFENKLIKKKSKDKRKQKASKPLHYRTNNNADIYVGKNSKQNDYITLKLARKEDLWFHVKDRPGSHVILKADNIHEDDIQIAAYLAAKNSSISNDNKVDVDYTEKKHVNKAKGAKAGMVYYENFSTMTIDMENNLEDCINKI